MIQKPQDTKEILADAAMEMCFDKLEGRIQATDEEYVEINGKILEKAIYPLLDCFAQLQEEKDSGRRH